MTKTKMEPITAADIGPIFTDAHEGRRVARSGLWYSATLSTDGNALLVDVADPTGPNGQRSFVVEFTVREVT